MNYLDSIFVRHSASLLCCQSINRKEKEQPIHKFGTLCGHYNNTYVRTFDNKQQEKRLKRCLYARYVIWIRILT